MSAETEPLESYFASDTLAGLIRSGLTLLKARRVRSRSEAGSRRLDFSDLGNQALYVLLIVIPAIILEGYHKVRGWLTGVPKGHPQGSWQWALHFTLREDPAHHTNETVGYYRDRPAEATDLDDLTAWVMTVIQFLWSYDDLMGVTWHEWAMLRFVTEAAQLGGLGNHNLFHRLQRQWELARPYNAPLNGTYADVRRAAFNEFITPRLEALPADLQEYVFSRYARARPGREQYQAQMSLRARLVPGRYRDTKEPLALWETYIGLIVKGHYYLINVVAHDENGDPLVYGQGGMSWPLRFEGRQPVGPSGEELIIRQDQVYRADDSTWVGYLDMAPASCVKWQLREVLRDAARREALSPDQAVDILLAETPRRAQRRLRKLLPPKTQMALESLSRAPILINWDVLNRDRSLAELRRAHRGIGDHALVIMRTESSIIFDQSHVFFDGTWSLAMAEVLTTAAVQWCRRCTTLAPSETSPPEALQLEASIPFLNEANRQRREPEVSAETTIWDISQIFKLRQMLLEKAGTRLTVNDLLVITRIFHAAHYRPSPQVRAEIEALQEKAPSSPEGRALKAIERSLERGRVLNPSLAIPVDASPFDPRERVFLLTFRNLADRLVHVWDDTWEAYQAYRRIEPPDTPEGREALQAFLLKRTFLISNLRAFSHILAASKAVAMRGASLSVAIFNLLSHLPPWLQYLLNAIPEHIPPLNEIIKGDEVYSNVGRVARGASLTRFMSAKDDGNTKALVWGVMTDDEDRLIVTMRDFRPHVDYLLQTGHSDLAHLLAQDYVVSYTQDLIGLVARLVAMLQVEVPS